MNKKTLIWTLIAIAAVAFGICLFIAQDVWATEFCFGLVFTILGSMLLGYVIAPQKKNK